MTARLNFLKRQLSFVRDEYGRTMSDLIFQRYRNEKEYNTLINRRDQLEEKINKLDLQVFIFTPDEEAPEETKPTGKLITFNFK